MSKRILVMPDGNWLSHTSRPFEIAKVLREMGHQVEFASEGQYMRLPRDAGFEVWPITTIDPDRVLACSRNGRVNWYEYDLVAECVAAELELFDRVRPDPIYREGIRSH